MLFRWHTSRLSTLGLFRRALSPCNRENIASRRIFTATNKNQHLRVIRSPSHFRLHTGLWTWRTLWFAPIIGGAAIYLSPDPGLHLPSIFSSPTLIPCPERRENPRRFNDQDLIGSPAEPHRSVSFRIIGFLQDSIWEPILTARRFIHLFCLFIPVIITMPMLMVGSPDQQLQGDRWGAVWWYDFLVKRMQAAGPTFIKVTVVH